MSSDQLRPNIADDSTIETGFGPITDNILNTIISKFNSNYFREKLSDKIIDPITMIINEKMQPYVYISIGLYIVVILLLLVIIYLILRKK
jgi:hypothetical protein